MKAKAPKAMVEPFNTNSTTKLWVIINNNGLLIQWLSEFMNLVVIVIVLLDLWKTNTFFPFLHSWKNTTKLVGVMLAGNCSHVCTSVLSSRAFPLLQGHYKLKKITKCKLMLPLKKCSLDFCGFVFLFPWSKQSTMIMFTSFCVLLRFGCGGRDFE
jgi:hypothetical protein